MKKYTATITESDIRFSFREAAANLEEDNLICFPDDDARTAFIEDCVSSEIDKYELYGRDPFECPTDYAEEVLDMAELYGYQL